MNHCTPLTLAETLTDYWAPRVISQMDDIYIKVARLKGSLVWHKHDNEDELFYVLKGSLVIELEDKSIKLNTHDLYVVPKGVLHNPVAIEECLVMIIEQKNTLHTGSTITQQSKSIDEQLMPLA